jgi:hypothetical protein
MSRRVWIPTLALAGIATVGLAAQMSSSSSQSAQPNANPVKITVTGCVERSSATSGMNSGQTGTSGTMANEPMFVLTNATSQSSGSSSTTGTSGTASSSNPTATRYQLEAPESRLSSHVGEKVEITGTLENSSTSGSTGSSGSTGLSGSTGTTGTMGGSTAGSYGSTGSSTGSSQSSTMHSPKLKVDTIRMISSTCSQ